MYDIVSYEMVRYELKMTYLYMQLACKWLQVSFQQVTA